MNSLSLAVYKFFKKHHAIGSPILLAFSGGSDSTALLHLCLEHQKKIGFELHVAHVDHGWRQTSRSEALCLAQIAESLGLIFHGKTLDVTPDADWENFARNKRYEFFTEIVKKINAQAVMLAHHADDQAEVILKRVFEGAHLFHLSGMKEVSAHKDIILWRPLLTFHKHHIKSYLEKKGLLWFEDKTNHEGVFLRTKMRKTIIPFLQQSFGKNPTSCLLRLSEQSKLVEEHFHQELLDIVQESLDGKVCLKKFKMSKLFSFLVIKRLCQSWKIKASYEEMVRAAQSLMGERKRTVINSNNLVFCMSVNCILINHVELNV